MFKKSWKRAGLVVGALLLAVLVGCQSIGGFDLTGMIVNQLDVKSAESSGSIDVQFEWNKEAVAAEGAEAEQIVALLDKLTLRVQHAAVDKNGNLALDGELEFGKGKIPFRLEKDQDALLLNVDGLKRPLKLYLSDNDAFGGSLFGNGGITSGAMQEAVQKLVKQTATYLVGHLPNPPVIDVSLVNAPVNGVDTNLTKVHAELNGKQLGDLIPDYLDALAKDEEGLRQLLQGIVQIAAELPQELRDGIGFEDGDATPTQKDIDEGVQALLGLFNEAHEHVNEAKEEDDWKAIFNEGVSLKTDLYVDKSMNIRKTSTEVKLSSELFGEEALPLKSVTIRSEQELWHVNDDFTVPKVSIPNNAMDAEQFFNLQPFQALRIMDDKSLLYGLLKNDFQIDDQEATLSSDRYWEMPFVTDEDGNVYVPIRETLGKLGVEKLNYHEDAKLVQFYDEATRQEVRLQTGTKNALLNGEPVKWERSVEVIDGFAYASADDLLGLLHAEYSLEDNDYGETLLHITRDL